MWLFIWGDRYMRESEKAVFTNMCMIYDDEGNVLVQDRKKSWCGIAFPGGHLEKFESVVDSVIREIKEETGLEIWNLELCGVKQWFNVDEGRNVCFLFKTKSFRGNLISSDEGKNFWIKKSEIEKYKLANNFDTMLNVFENDTINEHYHRDGDVLK